VDRETENAALSSTTLAVDVYGTRIAIQRVVSGAARITGAISAVTLIHRQSM